MRTTRSSLYSNNDVDLQRKNPVPNEGRLVNCSYHIAKQKYKEGLTVYELQKGNLTKVETFEKQGSYAFLDPTPNDNLSNI